MHAQGRSASLPTATARTVRGREEETQVDGEIAQIPSWRRAAILDVLAAGLTRAVALAAARAAERGDEREGPPTAPVLAVPRERVS
jgi:hypothetical protein